MIKKKKRIAEEKGENLEQNCRKRTK